MSERPPAYRLMQAQYARLHRVKTGQEVAREQLIDQPASADNDVKKQAT